MHFHVQDLRLTIDRSNFTWSNDTEIEDANSDNEDDNAAFIGGLIGILTTLVVPLVFGIIVFLGIIGNALVIVVVATNAQMRSTTNVLILNLALADLLFIVLCVPFTATDYALNSWPFGLIWCQCVQYLIYVTSYVSIYTLILMSFDRFLAVVFPVSSLPYRTVTNAFAATTVTWLLIGCSSVPIWFAHSLKGIRKQQPEEGKLVNETTTMSSFPSSTTNASTTSTGNGGNNLYKTGLGRKIKKSLLKNMI